MTLLDCGRTCLVVLVVASAGCGSADTARGGRNSAPPIETAPVLSALNGAIGPLIGGSGRLNGEDPQEGVLCGPDPDDLVSRHNLVKDAEQLPVFFVDTIEVTGPSLVGLIGTPDHQTRFTAIIDPISLCLEAVWIDRDGTDVADQACDIYCYREFVARPEGE